MIDEIVELAQRKIDERRGLIKSNELFKDYEKEYYLKSTDEEESLIHTAAEQMLNEEMISTEHLDYVVYRQFLWNLFLASFTPERLDEMIQEAAALCSEFGDKELGDVEDWGFEDGKHGKDAMQERHHLAWLIRAYNCMIQGIDVAALMTELEKVHYVLYNDEPM